MSKAHWENTESAWAILLKRHRIFGSGFLGIGGTGREWQPCRILLFDTRREGREFLAEKRTAHTNRPYYEHARPVKVRVTVEEV